MACRSGETRTAHLVPRAGLTPSALLACATWLGGTIGAAPSKPAGPR